MDPSVPFQRTIALVSSFSDRDLGRRFREELSSRLLVAGEKILDLLQGPLISIAWNRLHLSISLQLTNLLQFTMTFAIDFGPNKSLHSPGQMTAAVGDIASCSPADQKHTHTSLEPYRAFLRKAIAAMKLLREKYDRLVAHGDISVRSP